jgi:predicted Zn-dependent protease
VNQIAQLIAENTEFYDLPITVHVVDTDDIYANALPIGVIVISKGMLKQISSEHELACLIGHEIAHVTLGHGETEMDKRKVKFRAEDAFGELDEAFGTDTKEMDALADEMYERAIKGRKEEYEAEADVQGAIYAYRAGYEPDGMLSLMRKLETKIPRNPDPDDIRHWFPYSFKNRLNHLSEFISKELKTNEHYVKNENRYRMITAGL